VKIKPLDPDPQIFHTLDPDSRQQIFETMDPDTHEINAYPKPWDPDLKKYECSSKILGFISVKSTPQTMLCLP